MPSLLLRDIVPAPRRVRFSVGIAAASLFLSADCNKSQAAQPQAAAASPSAPPQHEVASEPATASAADAVVYGPWLLEVTQERITVAWRSRGALRGRVSFGESGFDRTAEESAAGIDHRVALEGLKPDTPYRYRIDAKSPVEGSFRTAPADSNDPAAQVPFKVLVYGDNRTNEAAHAQVVAAAEREGARLALHTGDMVTDANKEPLWASWFRTEHELLKDTPLVATVGNHEMTDHSVAYTAHFQQPALPPYRSLDYGPLHIVVLDSFEQAVNAAQPREGSISEAQRAWLAQDLAQVPKSKHVWMLVHQGPFSHPAHRGHGGSDSVREALHPYASRIEAIFAGHDHYYERGHNQGLRYFVLGGGGAPLYEPDAHAKGVDFAVRSLSYAVLDVCGCHVSGVVKDPAGQVLDKFTLSSCEAACPAQQAAGPR